MPLPQRPAARPLHAQHRPHPGRGGAERIPRRAASAQILFRTVGPTDALRRAIRGGRGARRARHVPVELPCHKGGRAPAGWETTVVSYASDLPFLGAWGEGYQLGPGTIRVAHTDEEHIRKADLLRGVDLYVRLATDLLAREAHDRRRSRSPCSAPPAPWARSSSGCWRTTPGSRSRRWRPPSERRHGPTARWCAGASRPRCPSGSPGSPCSRAPRRSPGADRVQRARRRGGGPDRAGLRRAPAPSW